MEEFTLDGKSYAEKVDDSTYKVRTCAWSPPGDHPVGCGLILTVKDGKVAKVEGDPSHPISQGRLCVRCLAIDEVIYHPDRVIYPMKRAREDRGKDKWERITWDEAIDLICDKVNQIKADYGAQSIMVFNGTGRESTLYCAPLAYAAIGTPNTASCLSGQACYGPRCSVADFILGAGYPELDYAAFFPDRYDDPRYEVPKYVILWGKDPLYSNPDGMFGHALIDLMKRGTQYIVIDPRVTWMAAHAAFHLQLRPGTDSAVGLGLLNVIISEDLYDHEFVEKWCYGLDELAERAAEYPPDRVEEISWVPAETLVAAARAFATASPCSAMWGVALDEQTNGLQASHCMLALAAITGNLDIPGGVTLAVTASFMGKWRYECAQELPPGLYDLTVTDPAYKAYNLGQGRAHPDMLLECLETDKPYPMKMAWFYATNPLACTAAQPERWLAGFNKLDFNVAQDLFMTPTAMALCDVFLPLKTFAEHDGVVLPHFGRNTHFLGAMNKAVEVGECRSDLEICFEFGKRLNPDAWPWENVAEFFTEQIEPVLGFTFESLEEQVVYQQPFEYRKYETGKLRPDGYPGFNTATGLVELNSTLYPQFDEDSLPYFQEPFYSPISQPDLAKEYPLVLTTGGRNIASFHSEHRQVPSLRALSPDADLTINPVTAKKLGIESGDWVAVENPEGRCVMRADVSYAVSEKVVHADHAWWYPEQDGEAPNYFGVFKSNINKLIPHRKVGKTGYGAPYKSVICRVYKVNSLDD